MGFFFAVLRRVEGVGGWGSGKFRRGSEAVEKRGEEQYLALLGKGKERQIKRRGASVSCQTDKDEGDIQQIEGDEISNHVSRA